MIGRMLLALGVVLGVMWLLARYAKRPLAGRPDGVLNVLARQQLTRNTSVAVVKVVDRALVVGVSEQGVQLLTETELEPIELALATERRRPLKPRPARSTGVLTGDRSESGDTGNTGDTGDSVDTDVLDPYGVDGLTQPQLGAPQRPAPGERRGALDGSILSRKTWSQLLSAARDATVRR